MPSKQVHDAPLVGRVEAFPIPALVIGPNGVIVAANSHAEAYLGCPALAGRNLCEFLAVSDPASTLRDLSTTAGSTELPLRRDDGEDRWGLVAVGPWRSGEIPADLVVFQDLTPQKMREAQLRQARDLSEQEMRSKMRFFAAASHDLRQPLQALALFVSTLERHVQTPAAERIFQSMKLSLRSMEELFESLLDMSRLDAGVLTPEPAVFMIGDVLETLDNEFSAQAHQAGLKFRVVASSLAVRSDQAMVARILRNFISNAVRYTHSGGVVVGCRRRGRFVRCEVWDTGAGIPADQQEEIFSEFFQGKAAVKRRGSGLGLAIVQRLALLLGHRLDLHSQEGRGSVFAVEVPSADLPSSVNHR
jgi:PAS domain S-box-containing protein